MLSYYYKRNYRRKRLEIMKPFLNERISQEIENQDDNYIIPNSENAASQPIKKTPYKRGPYKRKKKIDKYNEMNKNMKIEMEKTEDKLKAMKSEAETMEQLLKITIPKNTLTQYFICDICNGYLYNATTITTCLHVFCKGCIVKYLLCHLTCPRCLMLVHPSDPISQLKTDSMIQDLLYKIFPEVEKEEIGRETKFNENLRASLKDNEVKELDGVMNERMVAVDEIKEETNDLMEYQNNENSKKNNNNNFNNNKDNNNFNNKDNDNINNSNNNNKTILYNLVKAKKNDITKHSFPKNNNNNKHHANNNKVNKSVKNAKKNQDIYNNINNNNNNKNPNYNKNTNNNNLNTQHSSGLTDNNSLNNNKFNNQNINAYLKNYQNTTNQNNYNTNISNSYHNNNNNYQNNNNNNYHDNSNNNNYHDNSYENNNNTNYHTSNNNDTNNNTNNNNDTINNTNNDTNNNTNNDTNNNTNINNNIDYFYKKYCGVGGSSQDISGFASVSLSYRNSSPGIYLNQTLAKDLSHTYVKLPRDATVQELRHFVSFKLDLSKRIHVNIMMGDYLFNDDVMVDMMLRLFALGQKKNWFHLNITYTLTHSKDVL